MIKNYLILILSFLSFLSSAICAEVEGTRNNAGQEYHFIGLGLINNNPVCTFWIVKHGFLVTAKHCFTHLGMDEEMANRNIIPKLKIKFSSIKTSIETIVIEKESLKKIVFDRGVNDLAIITYSKEITMNSIKLPEMNFFEGVIDETAAVELVGYPDQDNKLSKDFEGRVGERIKSTGCTITGFTSVIMPTTNNPGYDGPLYDTTCAAWFIVGGGPVFRREKDGSFLLYGVVTHTFDVLLDGSIDLSKVSNDKFGQYSAANFSPFTSAETILDLLR